jgi:hypothetical protein
MIYQTPASLRDVAKIDVIKMKTSKKSSCSSAGRSCNSRRDNFPTSALHQAVALHGRGETLGEYESKRPFERHRCRWRVILGVY